MKKLYIDTTRRDSVILELSINAKVHKKEKFFTSHRDQTVLPLIIEFLQEHKISIQDLDKIEASPGPGSFTGIRIGMSVAQALCYALGLPQKSIEPVYSV